MSCRINFRRGGKQSFSQLRRAAASYRDADYTTGGTNGQYTFQSAADYVNKTPRTYQVTTIKPIHRARNSVSMRPFFTRTTGK